MIGIELARAMVTVRGDVSRLPSDLNAARPGVESAMGSMLASVTSLRGAIMGLAGAGAALGALRKAGQFEQTTIAFDTMLGSAQETKKTLSALTEFAAKTPFEMPEILQAARGLIQFGERGDDLMQTLNMLGNAASGTSTDFGMIAMIFNQIRGVGKLLTQDFRQLSTRGVMSLADIAKYYGVTTEAAQKMLSQGQISFEDLRKILASLSGEGGRFANLMEKQSQSLLGLWSTLKDAMGITARTIGEVLVPTAKDLVAVTIQGVEVVRNFVTEHKYLVEAVTKVAEAYVALKIAIWGAQTATKAYLALKTVGVATGVISGAAAGGAATVGGAAIAGAATTGAAAGTTAGIGLTAATGIGAVAVGIAAVSYEIYDLWKSSRQLEDEIAKSAQLDVEIAKVIAKEKEQANAVSEKQQAILDEEIAKKKKITDLSAQVWAANKNNKMQEDIWDIVHNWGLVGDELNRVIGLRRELQFVEDQKPINNLAFEVQALAEQWSEARKELEKYKREHPNAGVPQVREFGRVIAEKGQEEAAKSIREQRNELYMLEEQYTEVDKAVEQWARQHEGATEQQIADVRAIKQEEADLKEFDKKQEEIKSRAKQRTEATQTPQEKYVEELNKIKEELQGGFISPEVAERSTKEAAKQRREGMNKDRVTGAIGIVDYGKQIQNMILKGGPEAVQEKQLGQLTMIEKDMKALLEETKKKLGVLK
jgi:tape measure domain-containing protein